MNPILFSAFLSLMPSSGVDLLKICDAPDVKKITLPIYPGKLDSPTFEYSFRIIKNADANAETLIVIPGGPGESSINMAPLTALPYKHFQVIQTDPRGIGCNQFHQGALFPVDAIRSEYIASDILSIVNYLNPKAYWLVGTSYGTVVATMAAGIAETGRAQRPKAIVLNGTVGRVTREAELGSAYQSEWANLKKYLPSSILGQLSGSNLPLGFNSSEWGLVISSFLAPGEDPQYGNLALTLLKMLETDPGTLKEIINESMQETLPEEFERMHQIVSCSELYEKYPGNFNESGIWLEDGNLVVKDDSIVPSLCRNFRLTRPFDSSNWKTKAPIYYFQGINDPATPLWMMEYHAEHQTLSKRTMIKVQRAGHSLFVGSLKDCSEDIWRALATSQEPLLKEALKKCRLPSTIETILPVAPQEELLKLSAAFRFETP